ncbi:MAG: HAD family hydrolase [Bacilli bacterium]|nr:HAD family hydrolase [Bacilli bacterium]
MKEYDTYLIDFDGTIYDTKEALRPVFREAFGTLGIRVTDEECETFMHHTLLQAAQMKGVAMDQFQALVEATAAALDGEEAMALTKPFSDTMYLISELKKRNKRIAVVSGNISPHIRLVLRRDGIESDVHAVVGSDMFKHGKPSPEPLQLAMSLLGETNLDRTVYIGDSLQDEQAATAAHIDSIIIVRGTSTENVQKTTIRRFDEIFGY